MAHATPAALGLYKPRRPHASPLFRLVQDHLHRLQPVYDERFARECGPWRSVVAEVADKFLPELLVPYDEVRPHRRNYAGVLTGLHVRRPLAHEVRCRPKEGRKAR